MKVKIISGIMVILISGALLQHVRGTKSTDNVDPISGKDSRSHEILDATVQITMVVSFTDDYEVRAKGLGSLVSQDGETFLVTHNHWGEILQDATRIDIFDADHHLLKNMSGSEFMSLIRYQDAGTLVLEAPEDIAFHPAAKGSPIKAGDVVLVAFRQTAGGSKVSILEAVVDIVFTFQGLPAYKLLSRDGQPIRGGDSGGGVWHEGQLVGNMWATVEVESSPNLARLMSNAEDSVLRPTNKSLAALLTTNFQFSTRNQTIVEPVSKLRSELSTNSSKRNITGVE